MKVFQAKFVPLRKPTESQRQTIEQVKRWIEDAYTDLLWFVIPYEELRWEYD